MSHEVNTTKLAAMVRAKRGDRGLRTVATDIGGVSASTLSRVEAGHVPDLDTYLKLCRWLCVSPEEFWLGQRGDDGVLGSLDKVHASKADFLAAHLRADQTLPPETASALGQLIQMAYQQAEMLKQQAQLIRE